MNRAGCPWGGSSPQARVIFEVVRSCQKYLQRVVVLIVLTGAGLSRNGTVVTAQRDPGRRRGMAVGYEQRNRLHYG